MKMVTRQKKWRQFLRQQSFILLSSSLYRRGSMAECSARRTHHPAVPGLSPALTNCWIFSRSSRVQKSSAALVNSQLVASCQLGFLILCAVVSE